jgi:hypothetical protein
MSNPLFPLGQTVSTPGALKALAQEGNSGLEFLRRHVSGDWGDICDVAHDGMLSTECFNLLRVFPSISA